MLFTGPVLKQCSHQITEGKNATTGKERKEGNSFILAGAPTFANIAFANIAFSLSEITQLILFEYNDDSFMSG